MTFNKLPIAFVLPEDDEVATQEMAGADYYQQVTHNFSVFVVVSKQFKHETVDYDLIEKIKAQILKSIAGYNPDNGYDRIEYDGGGGIETVTRAFVVFKLRFSYAQALQSGFDITYLDTIELEPLKLLDITTKTEEQITSHIKVEVSHDD